MKIWLGTVLLIALVIVGYCSFKTYKEKHKLAHIVRNMLRIGFIIVFVNIFTLLSTTEGMCRLCYSIYFIATNWLLYYMLQFSLEYISSGLVKYVKKKLMIIILFLDSISLMLNNVLQHLFSLNKVYLFGDEIYFELVVTPIFYVHYTIILVMVASCLISLFYGAFTAPNFYRKKYLAIALLLVLLIVLNIFTFKSAIDVSVMCYVLEAICIYYCVFVYTPQRLLPKTLLMVSQDMTVALIVMDLEGKKIYNSNFAHKF